jgi:RHS repeat-associated protein
VQSYDPIGNPMGSYGAGFGFTGEQTDTNGLVHLRARYYDPGIGIWTALDPFEGSMGHPMSLNGYAWVEGNPVMNVDPSGMHIAQVCKAYAQGSPWPVDDAACVFVDVIVNGERYAQNVRDFFGSVGNVFTQQVGTFTLGTLNGIQFYALDENGNIYIPNRELYSSEVSILQEQFAATGECGRYPPGHPLSCVGGAGTGAGAIATPGPSTGDVGNLAGAAGILNGGVCEVPPPLMSGSQSSATATSTATTDTDDDEFDCSQYYALGYNFNFSDGTLISDYDLSYVSGIVHRGLAIGENPERGLIARAPGVRDVSPRSHNAGQKLSPWISTSKSAQTAMDIFNTSGQGVVAINLALVPSIKVDLSAAQGLASRGMFRNAAIAHEEVLVLDCIPKRAIIN